MHNRNTFNERMNYFNQKLQSRSDNSDSPIGIGNDPLFIYTPIRRVGNTIYFSASIDEYSQMVLTQYLEDIKEELLVESSRLGKSILQVDKNMQSIRIVLNSPGGYLHSGLALYDVIRNLGVPVECEVQGICASAASLILLASSERSMSNNSVVLLHQLSTFAIGTYENIKDNFLNCTMLMDKLKVIYLDETTIGLTEDEVSRVKSSKNQSEELVKISSDPIVMERRVETLSSLLRRDLELDRDKCIEFGIIDSNEQIYLTEEDVEAIRNFTNEVLEARVKSHNEETAKKDNPPEVKEETKKKSTSKKKKETN